MIKSVVSITLTCDTCGKEQQFKLDKAPDVWPPPLTLEHLGWHNDPTSGCFHQCHKCWLINQIEAGSARLDKLRAGLQTLGSEKEGRNE